MTITDRDPAVVGPTPTIAPIQCSPWCEEGDGHANSTSPRDQVCWGRSHYVRLSLEGVFADHKGDGRYETFPSFAGPCAHRGFNEHPAVYLHFTVNGHGHGGLLDDSFKLTAAEARELAANLITVADEIDGVRR